MEKCAVSIAPPTHNEHDKAHGKMGYGSYGRRQEPALLDVWLLDQSKSIEPSDLSYSTRPKQVKKLGTLTYSGDSVTRLEPFNCTSGEYYAVEVTCASGPCDVDIATTMYEPVGALQACCWSSLFLTFHWQVLLSSNCRPSKVALLSLEFPSPLFCHNEAQLLSSLVRELVLNQE